METDQIKIEIRARFMEVMEEIVHSGVPRNEFMVTIGDYQQNYRLFEKGTRYPTITNIALLASEYGYNPTWIITGQGSRKYEKEASPLERLEEIEKEVKELKKLFKKSNK